MFEHMIAETIKMSNRTTNREDELIDPNMRPVQFKPSLLDRVLPSLGDAMINLGIKLKYRSHASLSTEQVSVPNYLIML